MAKGQYVPIITRGEACRVNLEKIVSIEQNLRKIVVHTNDEAYCYYGKIDDVMKYLTKNFLKCHHSCIINLDKVERMKAGEIFFDNGQKITVCKEKFPCIRQQYAQHLLKQKAE